MHLNGGKGPKFESIQTDVMFNDSDSENLNTVDEGLPGCIKSKYSQEYQLARDKKLLE